MWPASQPCTAAVQVLHQVLHQVPLPPHYTALHSDPRTG